jgi:predicted nucleic acid-binding protein
VIVVDTNVLAYLLIPGKYTDRAENLLAADADWAAPKLWRSELRNVLSTYVRNKLMLLSDAVALYRRAADIIAGEEYDVAAFDVLRLSQSSGCSAYDCEFVALAEFLDVKFVSADAKLVKAFPKQGLLLF